LEKPGLFLAGKLGKKLSYLATIFMSIRSPLMLKKVLFAMPVVFALTVAANATTTPDAKKVEAPKAAETAVVVAAPAAAKGHDDKAVVAPAAGDKKVEAPKTGETAAVVPAAGDKK